MLILLIWLERREKELGGESVNVLSESVCPEVEFSFVDKIWPSFLQRWFVTFAFSPLSTRGSCVDVA